MTLLSRPFGRSEGGDGAYYGTESQLGQGIWTRAVALWNERWMNRTCAPRHCYELVGRARQRREVPCGPPHCSPPAGVERMSLVEAWPLIHDWSIQAMRRALAEQGNVANTPAALTRRWPNPVRSVAWPSEAQPLICAMKTLVANFLIVTGAFPSALARRPFRYDDEDRSGGFIQPRRVACTTLGASDDAIVDLYHRDPVRHGLVLGMWEPPPPPPFVSREQEAIIVEAAVQGGQVAYVAGAVSLAVAQAAWEAVPENRNRRRLVTQLRSGRRCESAQECQRTGANCCLGVNHLRPPNGTPCSCGNAGRTALLAQQGLQNPWCGFLGDTDCNDTANMNRALNEADRIATNLWNQRWRNGGGRRPDIVGEIHTMVWQWGFESMRRGLIEAAPLAIRALRGAGGLVDHSQQRIEQAWAGRACGMIIAHCAKIWDFILDRGCTDTPDDSPVGRARVRDAAREYRLLRPSSCEQIYTPCMEADWGGCTPGWVVPQLPGEDRARNISNAVMLGGPGMNGLGGLGENLPGVPSDIALRAKTMVADQTHGGVCPPQEQLEIYLTDVLIDAGLGESGLYAPEHVEWVRGQLRMTATMHCKDIWARGDGGAPAPDPVDPEVDPLPPAPRSTSSSTSGILVLGLVAAGAWALWRGK